MACVNVDLRLTLSCQRSLCVYVCMCVCVCVCVCDIKKERKRAGGMSGGRNKK